MSTDETKRKPRLIAILMLYACSGCQSGDQAMVARYQATNQQLAEQTRAQRAEIERLRAQGHQIEKQLVQAETELARLDARFVSHGRMRTADGNSRDGLTESRPNDRATSADGTSYVRRQLAELASRYPALHFDPETGISKLDTDVLFDSGQDVLKPNAHGLLEDFAAVLNDPQARSLKIMVVGHTDSEPISGRETRDRFPTNWHLSASRALAVAQQLQDAGIDGQRMGFAGFGKHQPIVSNDDPQMRQQNRRVEIFVMSPDVPVVGMTETLSDLY